MVDKIVNVSKLNIRNYPKGSLQGYIKSGTEVEVFEEKSGWSKIKTTAWVMSDYLRDLPESETVSGEVIKRIVIHCSATKPDYNATAEDIKKWHTDPVFKGGRGWSRAGYHWVIEREPCRVVPLVAMNDDEVLESWEISNGVRGYNKDSIHVCYVGGLNEKGRPADNITPEQTEELVALLQSLVQTRPNLQHIVGHTDLYPLKACPSFDVAKFLHKNLSQDLAKKYALPLR
ncbi:MAG: SH3 domain-containing protein [Candidatus Portiera sp.]|nr:SH3 domain-containing protein [Portiera sp.]